MATWLHLSHIVWCEPFRLPFPRASWSPSVYLLRQSISCFFPGGVLSLILWFPDNLPWVSMEAYGNPAACWILHQGLRGIDYKRQSSRDNEEKQNANAHFSGCCGNYRDMLLLCFKHYYRKWDVICRSQIHEKKIPGFSRSSKYTSYFYKTHVTL